MTALTEIQKQDMPVKILNGKAQTVNVKAQQQLGSSENKYDVKKLRKLKILLVEDNRLNVLLIRGLFMENKMKLYVTENGSACIEKLKKGQYDVILMDLKMPVVTGYEATVIIRNDLKNNIPIIAMTGYETMGDRERCLGIGMNGYITKPVNADLLFQKIYELTSTS